MLALFRFCEDQVRIGFDGPVAYDLPAIRAIAIDLGFEVTGEKEFDDGALFWSYVRALAHLRLDVLREGKDRVKTYEALEARRGKPRV